MTEATGTPSRNQHDAAARARGRTGGRPSVITPEILRAASDLLPNPEHNITSIAKLLGVSPGTLYNHIPSCDSYASAELLPPSPRQRQTRRERASSRVITGLRIET